MLMSDSNFPHDENPEHVAARKKCTVFYPNNFQLTIDIDSEESYEIFQKRFGELKRLYPDATFETQELPSSSGPPNRHIIVTTSLYLDTRTQILLQFALGSDRVRETMNLWRNLGGIEKPIRLFRPME